MRTTKQLIISLIIIIVASGLVSLFHLDPFMDAFIGGGFVYNMFRASAVALLVILLVSNPPRSLHMRALLGVGSMSLIGLMMYQFSIYQLHLLDAFIFIELAIIFAIEALETYEVRRRRGGPLRFQER